ncbi:MAG: DUF2092 domain-containing protein, partial [Planctomycetota bacterium]
MINRNNPLRLWGMLLFQLACCIVLPPRSISLAQETEITVDKEVKQWLIPLFDRIQNATVSRATIALSEETLELGAVAKTRESTYQIASKAPDQFTVYFKQPDERRRVYCDGKQMVVAVSPEAYLAPVKPISTGEAVLAMPVPLGPYPEPLLALTLAGVDPSVSFLSGMKSVAMVGKEKFRGVSPSFHIRGVQQDDVSWDLWVSDESSPRPLRLIVDMTNMLRSDPNVQIPQGVEYQLRCDFSSWRISGEVDESLFVYQPKPTAKAYDSLDDYYESFADA